jgi:hypothetical protein
MPCQKAWCESWYKAPKGSSFPIQLPEDDDINVFVNEEDNTRFLEQGLGVMFFVPFDVNCVIL